MIKKPCNYLGCNKLIDKTQSYCDEHNRLSRQRYNQDRPDYHKWYSLKSWKNARQHYLRRNPFCVNCNEPASVVDHICDHRGDYGLFWNRNNWQSMCKTCHNRKTMEGRVKHGC